MRKPRTVALVALVALVGAIATALLAGFVALGSVDPGPPTCPRWPDPARFAPRLLAPAEIAAGEPLRVRVLVPGAPSGLPATVALLRADGPVHRDASFESGRAEVEFGPAATMAAGQFALTAAVCEQSVTRAVRIVPGAAVAPLDPLVGPRRIVANADSVATAVTVPVDALGNPVASGSEVRYQLRRPDGRHQTRSVRTERLLGVLLVRSGTVAGHTLIAATADDARSTAADLVETPGAPRPGFPIMVIAGADATVGARDREVVLEDLTDVHGNRLADGTLVTLLVDGPGVVGRAVQAPLIDGSARVALDPPDEPGDVRVQAVIDGVASATVTSSFGPPAPAADVPLRIDLDRGLGILDIEIGPVVGDLEAYVPDGTEASLRISRPDGSVESIDVRLTNGVATIDVPATVRGRYAVVATTPFGSAQASAELR